MNENETIDPQAVEERMAQLRARLDQVEGSPPPYLDTFANDALLLSIYLAEMQINGNLDRLTIVAILQMLTDLGSVAIAGMVLNEQLQSLKMTMTDVPSQMHA